MKTIIRNFKSELGINIDYRIWYNPNFGINSDTVFVIGHDGRSFFNSLYFLLGFRWQAKKPKLKWNANICFLGIGSYKAPLRAQLLTPFRCGDLSFDEGYKAFFENPNFQPLGEQYLKDSNSIINSVAEEFNLKDAKKILVGASLGAMINIYALSLSEFSNYDKYVLLSPAIWYNKERIMEVAKNVSGKNFFLSVGTKEAKPNLYDVYLNDAKELNEVLSQNNKVKFCITENAKHGPLAWIKVLKKNLHAFEI